MERVIEVVPLREYTLRISFADGVTGTIDLRPRLFGPVFEPLKDPQLFERAYIDEFGVVCWPNGADLAPDALYERVRGADVS